MFIIIFYDDSGPETKNDWTELSFSRRFRVLHCFQRISFGFYSNHRNASGTPTSKINRKPFDLVQKMEIVSKMTILSSHFRSPAQNHHKIS